MLERMRRDIFARMSSQDELFEARRELASAGGKARAAKLSKEERVRSARRAALARHSVPKATHTGELHIGETTFDAAVLEDGRRVLSEDNFMRGMGMYWSGWVARERREAQAQGSAGLPLFLSAKSLKPFIDKDLSSLLESPVKYRHKGNVAHGIRADLIPRICRVWLEARDAQALRGHRQRDIAAKADILMRALAEVGITALVDEATGYQEDRSRRALQEILDKFIAEEFSKWAKRFPDEFYRQLFRLRGWDYSGMTVARPSVVGRWTNNIVYDRLAPAVRRELEARNPKNAGGHRPRKHHQHLTPDVGHPKLDAHLYAVIGLMKACLSWDEFKRMLDRAHPKYPDMPLFDDRDEAVASA